MTISETNKIDIVATRPDSSIVRLVISEHLEWDPFEAHAILIEDKVNAYLSFVESGQLQKLTAPPIPEDPEIHIVLAVAHAPSDEAEAFFARVRDLLARVRITFVVEVRSPS